MMDSDLFKKASEIFLEARRLGPEERGALLARRCGENAALREQVEILLAADQGPDPFGTLDDELREIREEIPLKPTGPWTQTAVSFPGSQKSAVPERPGTQIGRYKLLQLIGEGGFGSVFMAEQEKPVRRRVALKIIKLGMDTRQVIARFEAERQALAMMDHPSVAKVFDGGATETGRPYFVMELVKGIPITEYCDKNNLTIPQRLELFMQVCQAVQHAHQKGLIHRDIKPSNVLVATQDDRPVPKIIDFGIAKAVQARLTEKTLFTDFRQMIGTPEYMSPEQAEGDLDIDTRCDVYALGVLLYELLAGSPPFDARELRSKAFGEMQRIIREVEPPTPSTRVGSALRTEKLAAGSSADGSHNEADGPHSEPYGLPTSHIAAHRRTDARTLVRTLRGELDWIVMRCLEKDRGRRYETANGLAADVQRYLQDEAVLACPPSAGYRFRKFARRNKGPLGAIMAVALALVIGTGVATWQAFRAAAALKGKGQALAVAEVQSRRAEQSFLRASIAIREVLTKAAIGAGEWSQLPPPLRKRFSEEAVNFYQGLLNEGNPDPDLQYEAATGYRAIGTLHARSKEPQQAEESFRRSITILDRLSTKYPAVPQYRHQLAYSHYNLGRTLHAAKRLPEAQTGYEKGAALYEKLLSEAPDSIDYRNELTLCFGSLSALYEQAGDRKRAEGILNRAIEILNGLSTANPEAVAHKEQLAGMYRSLGRLQADGGQVKEAKAAFHTAAELYEKTCSATPTESCLYGWVQSCKALLELPSAGTQPAEEENEFQQFLSVLSRAPANLQSDRILRRDTGHTHRLRAYKLLDAGRTEEGERALVNAQAVFDQLIIDEPDSADHWHFAADTRRRIAELMIIRGDRGRAEQALRRSIEIHEQRVAKFPNWVVSESEAERAVSYIALIRLLKETNQPQEAAKVHAHAVAGYEKLAAEFPDNSEYQLELPHFLRDAGDVDRALAQYSAIMVKRPDMLEARRERGRCYLDKGDFTKALEDFSELIRLKPDVSWYWCDRGFVYLRSGEHEKAIVDLSKAIGLADAVTERHMRGEAYRALGQWQQAETDFSRAIELRPDWDSWHRRGQLYAELGQWDKAQADLANAIKRCPSNPEDQNSLAWTLAMNPDPQSRNPKMAVELAEKAVAARPTAAHIWNTLGVAHYRAGNWQAGITALEKSQGLRRGGDAFDWFFLAMAYHQLGDRAQARRLCDKAIEWMDKNSPKNKKLGRFRAEAAELLGIPGSKPSTAPTTQP